MTWRPYWLLTALACATSLPAAERKLPAEALAQMSALRDVRLAADGRSLELVRGVLVEDDGPAAGFSYQPNEEKLAAGVLARKELLVADPHAAKAVLLVAPGGQLQARINGREVALSEPAKAGNYWQAYALPADLLRAGKNEIVLSGAGKLWIARDDEYAAGSTDRKRHPNRSAKSTDGGQTWDDQKLGTAGNVDGEYYVRLALDQFVPAGTITLPVLDAGNLADEPIAPRVKSLAPLRVGLQADLEAGGTMQVRARTGDSASDLGAGWSDWQELRGAGGTIPQPRGRFVQVAIELRTRDGRHSPRLKSLSLSCEPEVVPPPAGVRVAEARNASLTMSSIPFAYEPFDQPALKKLREQHRLDEVTAGAKDEWELICRLAAWSSQQWKKGHLRDCYPAWNALDILQPHADGTPVGGFCQQYNVVFLQACESFGLVGRAVSLGSGDHGLAIRSGHEVVEIWSNQHAKWTHVDGNAAWYFADEKTGVPLSLRELRERQLMTLAGQTPPPLKHVKLAEQHYPWDGLTGFPPFAELRLIPRSNFLAAAAPLPLHQGMRGWFWTGHYVWSDDRYPASLLYRHRVHSARDWDWTVNQVQWRLTAGEQASEIDVALAHNMPGFDRYEIRLNDGPAQSSPAAFPWKLQPGRNRLEAWAVNALGRRGSSSLVVVESP